MHFRGEEHLCVFKVCIFTWTQETEVAQSGYNKIPQIKLIPQIELICDTYNEASGKNSL